MLTIVVLFGTLSCIAGAKLKNDGDSPSAINESTSSDCIYPAKIGNQADYYWRDYFGVIPKNAIPGGYTEDGNVTYVGQLGNAKSSGIYPGNIYPGKKEAEICDGVRFVDGTYVKILCLNPQNKYEWRKTTINESPLLTDFHWAIGGSQPARVLYIGRAYIEGEVKVGRVYDITYPHKGLWICNRAGTQVNFHSFELLVISR